MAVLPFLEQGELYKQFKLDEPWDSEHNKKLLAKMPAQFEPPLKPKGWQPNTTFYQVFVGDQTLFPPGKALRLADLGKVSAGTLMIVEAGEAVPWTKPEDLPYDPARPLPMLGGIFNSGFQAVTADGRSGRFLPKNTPPATLRAMISPRRGEEGCPTVRESRLTGSIPIVAVDGQRSAAPAGRASLARGFSPQVCPHLFRLMARAPWTRRWSFIQPRQSTSQPGGRSCLRFWWPPNRPRRRQNSRTVNGRTSPYRSNANTSTYSWGNIVAAALLSASGRRDSVRSHNNHSVTTDKKAIAGCNACSVVNCRSSIPQPVFMPLWYSSTTQRRQYQSTRSHASASVWTGTLVSKNHSSGSASVGVPTSQTRSAYTVKGTPRSSPRGCRGGTMVTSVQATATVAVRADRSGRSPRAIVRWPCSGNVRSQSCNFAEHGGEQAEPEGMLHGMGPRGRPGHGWAADNGIIPGPGAGEQERRGGVHSRSCVPGTVARGAGGGMVPRSGAKPAKRVERNPGTGTHDNRKNPRSG